MADREASNVPKIFAICLILIFCFEGSHKLVFLSFAVLYLSKTRSLMWNLK